MDNLRIVSYIPRTTLTNSPHELITDYNPIEFLTDLRLVKELGFNTLRIYVPYGRTDSRGDFCLSNGAVIPKYLYALEDIFKKASDKQVNIALVLFGWLDSYQSGEDKYSAINQEKHYNYIWSIRELGLQPAYVSLAGEANADIYGFWTVSEANRDMVIDWVHRMRLACTYKIPTTEKWTPHWDLTVGMTNPTDWDYKEDYFRRPSWGGSCIAEMVDFLAPHFYNPYNIDGHGDIENWCWTVRQLYQGRILVEELPTDNPENIKWFLEQLKRTNLTEYGFWKLYSIGNRGHGLLNQDGTVRYPQLFHLEGERYGPRLP